MRLHALFVLFVALVFENHSSCVAGWPTTGTGYPVEHGTKHLHEKLKNRSLRGRGSGPIDVSGSNQFVPPNFSAGDQRGPCPGLNALANHGYLPHNGVTSMAESIIAVNEVFGMGLDLGTILSTMGTVFFGNPLSLDPGYSIGGVSSNSQNLLGNLLGLLGTPQGIDASHNLIEADSSNTRGDLYQTGNVHSLVMSQYNEWIAMSPDGTFDMDSVADRAYVRFGESVAQNPYFYYGPYSGIIARNTGYAFTGRLFANYSAENPDGLLTTSIIENFYAITTNSDGSQKYQEGWERIPPNWYPRPVGYSLVDLNLDIINFILKYPELGSIGGNTGTVNSFTGLDLGNITGGVFNAETLLEGNNLMCFALEVVKTVSPDALSSLYATLSGPLSVILDALETPLLDLACPQLASLTAGGEDFFKGVQKLYPGAAKAGAVL